MSKYPNEFAAWRVSFQNDRQAAESAFDDLIESAHELNQLDIELRECKRNRGAILVGVPRIEGVPEAAFVWNDPDEAGRYPRVDDDGSVATRDEYDLSPASIGQVRALFNRMVSAALETERRKLERLRSAALDLHQEIESWGCLSPPFGEAKSRLLQALISSEPGE